MIFVTVGTHEQPFNRLVENMDHSKKSGTLDDEVIIQTGISSYKPNYCSWSNLYAYQDMVKYVEEARIVITHGGPSSFIMPLQFGKIPIVVPRQKRFGEHVNDHQLDFARSFAERQGNIIVIENIEELQNTILHYARIIKSMTAELKSNNALFNIKFQAIVNEITEERK